MDNFEYDYKLLKDTRLAKNISIENIAFNLCLTVRQIHSIENNLEDYFYSPAIKLICVKKYAEKLGINIEVVLYKLKKEEDLKLDKIEEELPNKTDETIITDEVVIAHHKTTKAHQTKNHCKQSCHIIIELSVEYIEKNLENKITMPCLTKLTGYSERSIQLAYQKYLNKSPFEYITEQRFLKARELIEIHKKSKKITEIAQKVGLVHLGRFSVNFRKRFGITPSALSGG